MRRSLNCTLKLLDYGDAGELTVTTFGCRSWGDNKRHVSILPVYGQALEGLRKILRDHEATVP